MASFTFKCPHRDNNGSDVLWVIGEGNPIWMLAPEEEKSEWIFFCIISLRLEDWWMMIDLIQKAWATEGGENRTFKKKKKRTGVSLDSLILW